MRKVLVAVALTAFMAASGLQAAMTITPVTGSAFSGANSGGEFKATQVSASLLAATGNLEGYAASTAGADYFHTFCIEKTETFTPGSTYEVALNNAAIYNGQNGLADPISMGTAWLYSQFAAGTLAGYNDTTTGLVGPPLPRLYSWLCGGWRARQTSEIKQPTSSLHCYLMSGGPHSILLLMRTERSAFVP